jgi:hypothetical protein
LRNLEKNGATTREILISSVESCKMSLNARKKKRIEVQDTRVTAAAIEATVTMIISADHQALLEVAIEITMEEVVETHIVDKTTIEVEAIITQAVVVEVDTTANLREAVAAETITAVESIDKVIHD